MKKNVDVYTKHTLRDIDSGRYFSFSLAEPFCAVGDMVQVEGALACSEFNGKSYLSVRNPSVRALKMTLEEV